MTACPPPRLVACDLDGTVLRSDGTVSARTRAALAAVERAGATLVLVTGRPPRWIHPVAEQTDHRGLAICANGALVYDLATETVVESDLIDVDTLAAVIAVARDVIPDAVFAIEYGGSYAYEHDFPIPERLRSPDGRAVAADALATAPAVKLLLRHESRVADDLLAAAREVLSDLVEVTHSSPGGAGLLEMSALGVSKASTLARMCARRGIDAAEVIAFGDMPNDLPMLAWAGRPYAMGNAHPDVLAAVDRHTVANDHDGVAVVLEGCFCR